MKFSVIFEIKMLNRKYIYRENKNVNLIVERNGQASQRVQLTEGTGVQGTDMWSSRNTHGLKKEHVGQGKTPMFSRAGMRYKISQCGCPLA